MLITYHLKIKTPDNTGEIHHSCLHKDIQDFIVAKGEKQTIYKIKYNGFYQFIYTVTGNRIDITTIMKFQYKINGVIEFQTDSIYEFIAFLNKSGDTKSVLAHLLDQKGSYTADFNTH